MERHATTRMWISFHFNFNWEWEKRTGKQIHDNPMRDWVETMSLNEALYIYIYIYLYIYIYINK